MVQLDKDTILVTGGCGFIGSNFINNYFHNFGELVNIDFLDYCSDEYFIEKDIRDNKNYFFVKGNLMDKKIMGEIFKKYDFNYIIHFAAFSHVDSSFDLAEKYVENNILSTTILFEYTKRYCRNLKKFIHISTDEVYGESELDDKEGKKENVSFLYPTNPYAASKMGSEAIAMAFEKSYNIPLIITRSNNIYGMNQHEEKLIPKFIKRLKNNQKVTIHGNGECLRRFLYVEDLTKALYTIIERGTIGEIYNIGSDEEYSVLQISEKLIKLIHPNDEVDKHISFVNDRFFNDKRYFVNSEKIKKLGWEIKNNLDEKLVELIKTKYYKFLILIISSNEEYYKIAKKYIIKYYENFENDIKFYFLYGENTKPKDEEITKYDLVFNMEDGYGKGIIMKTSMACKKILEEGIQFEYVIRSNNCSVFNIEKLLGCITFLPEQKCNAGNIHGPSGGHFINGASIFWSKDIVRLISKIKNEEIPNDPDDVFLSMYLKKFGIPLKQLSFVQRGYYGDTSIKDNVLFRYHNYRTENRFDDVEKLKNAIIQLLNILDKPI